MSAQVLNFRIPPINNDNDHFKYMDHTLKNTIKHIEYALKFIAQMQDPTFFHPKDTPSMQAYLKMSQVLIERANQSIDDVLVKHRNQASNNSPID